jgi:transposase
VRLQRLRCAAAQIGKDVSEQLEYVPAHFKVIRHVRPKLACVKCHTIFQASAPSRPIAKGVAGAGLLAHVLVSKYCDHLPLYRQSGIYARSGVDMDRSTLAGWVDQAEQLLDPLVAALGRYTMGRQDARRRHAGQGAAARRRQDQDRDACGCTSATTGRSGQFEHRQPGTSTRPTARVNIRSAHLKGYPGILQADAYGGWGKLYDSGPITEAACWAHARRPWWDLYCDSGRSPDSIAAQALTRIRALCHRSRHSRAPPDVRQRAAPGASGAPAGRICMHGS